MPVAAAVLTIWLAILPALLVIAGLLTVAAIERFDAAAEAIQRTQSRRLIAGVLPLLLLSGIIPAADTICGLAYLLVQLVHAGANPFFGTVRFRIDAAAQPIGCALNAVIQAILIGGIQGIPQLAGDSGLCRCKLASRVAKIILQPRKVFGELLAIVSNTVSRVRSIYHLLHRGCRTLPVLLIDELTDAVGLIAFFLRNAVGLLRKAIELAAGLLLLRASHQTGCLAKRLCGTPCCLIGRLL